MILFLTPRTDIEVDIFIISTLDKTYFKYARSINVTKHLVSRYTSIVSLKVPKYFISDH